MTAIPTIELAYEGLTEKLYTVQIEGFERPAAKKKLQARAIFDVIRAAAVEGHE